MNQVTQVRLSTTHTAKYVTQLLQSEDFAAVVIPELGAYGTPLLTVSLVTTDDVDGDSLAAEMIEVLARAGMVGAVSVISVDDNTVAQRN